MSYYRGAKSPLLGALPWIVVIIAVVGVLLIQRLVLNALITWVHVTWWLQLGLLLCLALVAIGSAAGRAAPVAAAVLIAAVTLGLLAYNGYARADAVYEASVTPVTEQAVDDYDQRAPFTVARARAASQVTSNGTLNDTTYLADEATFGTAVSAQGTFAGYSQVVEQSIDLTTGQVATTTCEFDRDRAHRRLGGLLHHSLNRAIIAEAGYGTVFDVDDAYAYCDGERPVVVVPIMENTGAFPVHRVAAGVALYDGLTGKVSIDREPADVPGPVYPLSLAEQQRDSTRSADGWWRYLLSQAGYALPQAPSAPTQEAAEAEGEGQPGDPKNVSEYNLALAGSNKAEYVSSLIPLQGGSRIVAVSSVPSTTLTPGELNPMTVTVLTPEQQRDADVTVAQQVRNNYQSLGWASGLSVFEVAPVGDHEWAVTIGYSQELAYRVLFDSAEGTMTLTAVGGNQEPEETPETDEPAGQAAPGELDVADLSDAQLALLLERVSAEVAERMGDEG